MADDGGDAHGRWRQIRAAARDAELSDAEFRMWMLLRTYEGPDGAFPSAETLAEHLGKSPRTVRRHRAQLVEKGFLTRHLRGPKPASFRTTVPAGAEAPAGDDGDPAAAGGPGDEEGDDYPAPSEAVGGNYPEEFEAAWGEYPGRDGPNNKRAAYGTWRARVRNGADPSQLEEATRVYRRRMEREDKVGTRFVKQASTFFGPKDHWREELRNGKPNEPPAADRREVLRQYDGADRE